ncbi:MAG: response regulator transcription factor [Planctomycetaceae bacterium]|nr:response regulator transcription factor [Planctomycetaceae bacterium]
MAIQLLIADDHELIRDGLRLTFDGTEVSIVAEATNGREAFEQLGRHCIDVALVDISMPGGDGFLFLELVRAAGVTVPVVMHSMNDGHVRRSRALGAAGFVVKGQEHKLVPAVRAVYSGGEFWDDTPGT